VRNLFDQYNQPENRLSHALAVCLHEDRRLLESFLLWAGISPPSKNSRLFVVEQTLPGDSPEPEEDAEHKGLPDIVIHDGDSWCVLIESKIQAAITEDQLKRHRSTMARRGFEQIVLIALIKAEDVPPSGVTGRTWCGLYEWLGKTLPDTEWSKRLRGYLRIAEVRLARDGYLTEGTLTMFDGFPFTSENPYTYGEGKRLLKLAMQELRKNASLKAIGMDPDAPGRGAITGRSGSSVWDFLSLRDRPEDSAFTKYPHLTLSVKADYLEVAITIPNGVTSSVKRRLIALKADGLAALNGRIVEEIKTVIPPNGSIEAYALQRHYTTQRAPAITDARLHFNLETSRPHGGRIRHQPEWTALFASLLQHKRANIQFGYYVKLPWDTQGIDSRESLSMIAGGWIGMRPLLDVLRGKDAKHFGRT